MRRDVTSLLPLAPAAGVWLDEDVQRGMINRTARGAGRLAAGVRLAACMAALSLVAAAVPPNPVARGPFRKAGRDLPGESHVPGFPNTPERLDQAYLNAFIAAETESAMEERMLHAFTHPDMRAAVCMFLPRYYSPRLLEQTRKLARHSDPAIQAGALAALISQLDDAPATRVHVRGLLRAGSPAVRGRAAEYLCWLGIPEDYQALSGAAASERDPHSRAAMTEAAAAIKRRATVFGDGPAGPTAAGTGPAAIYQNLADTLAANPTAATRRAVLARMRGVEPFEPSNLYADHLTDPVRGDALIRVHRLLAGYPAAPEDAGATPEVPVSPSVLPPVRDYADPKRKSYGIFIDPAVGGPLAGRHHVGDDVAWRQDQETVVSIGNGVVRLVEQGKKSWGGLIVVEHINPKGERFCSLYGHLGPLICVHEGEVVRMGQKLGAVGISYSHANGGFLAHLHFGIHRSAFLLPDRAGETVQLPGLPGETLEAVVTAIHEHTAEVRLSDGAIRSTGRRATWVTGYLKPEWFKGAHRWVDPQVFIRQYGR